MIEITNPTEFRKNMKKKLDCISDEKQHMIIHRSGEKEDIVMIPISEYNSWQETNYLLSSQNNRNHLFESLKQARDGDTFEIDIDDL